MNRPSVIDLLWRVALREAVAAHSQFIEPEHFLEALTKGNDFCRKDVLHEVRAHGVDSVVFASELRFVPELLDGADVNPTELRRAMRALLGSGAHEHLPGIIVHRSDRTRAIFNVAKKVAADIGIGGTHAGTLFIALLSEDDSLAVKALAQKGGDPEKLKASALARLRQQGAAHANQGGSDLPHVASPLEKFGRDLTRIAKDGLLNPVIGRRKEILQVIQSLSRSTKNNPVLVGEPGVGKTAIVEALAQRIVAGKETQVLSNKRIVEINMGALVAGTKYYGEFEERLNSLLVEAKSDPNLILFIDEIHTIIGAGERAGGLNAANMMKSALARGEIKCIGATTLDEYRKYIEKDPALERRFNKITVLEPVRDEAVQIIQGLRPRFEKYHKLRIADAAIEAAVDLSIRFDVDHRLPDKAIDLVDLACAQLCVPDLSIRGSGKPEDELVAGEVTPAAIVAVMSEKSGVPVEVIASEIKQGSKSKLAGLKDRLRQRIIGQEDAIARVYNRLLLAYAALNERRGPLGVFLFLGPSGVGKTELTRALADNLFRAEKNLIRLDMSEYMEQHSIARLIGSPPGYIGHDEEGQLTGKLRTTPYSIVLMDEIEKAHPKVLDLFLQVFDEGRVTDGKGRTVDAKNAIFIMTSNIGNDIQDKRKPLGFNAGDSNDVERPGIPESELKKYFRLEMINRIEEIICFSSLTDSVLTLIAQAMLDNLTKILRERHRIELQIDDGIIQSLCEEAQTAEFGARNLRRVIQNKIEIPVIQLLAESPMEGKSRIHCGAKEGQIVVVVATGKKGPT